MNKLLYIFLITGITAASLYGQEAYEKDIIKTSSGNLEITFLGHGTLMVTFSGKVIHIDPWSRAADYSKLPKADIILITHQHGDHLDAGAIDIIRTDNTALILTGTCAESIKSGDVMKNGESKIIKGITIEAVPAYNIVHKRDNGSPFHPKGEGNGYVITFGDKKLYVAGDTENVPEMKNLKGIDIAFLPMNLPYTMTPEMAANAARSFKPKILYPYHFGNTDTAILVKMLENEKDIDVRIRKMK